MTPIQKYSSKPDFTNIKSMFELLYKYIVVLRNDGDFLKKDYNKKNESPREKTRVYESSRECLAFDTLRLTSQQYP